MNKKITHTTHWLEIKAFKDNLTVLNILVVKKKNIKIQWVHHPLHANE